MGKHKDPGTWYGLRSSDGKTISAVLMCPLCHKPIPLIDFVIEADGRVIPWVWCMYIDCTFEFPCQLIGWKEWLDA